MFIPAVVIAALIAGLFGVIAAVLPVLISSQRTSRRLGHPNGYGTVVGMLSELFRRMDSLEATLQAGHENNSRRIERLEEDVAQIRRTLN